MCVCVISLHLLQMLKVGPMSCNLQSTDRRFEIPLDWYRLLKTPWLVRLSTLSHNELKEAFLQFALQVFVGRPQLSSHLTCLDYRPDTQIMHHNKLSLEVRSITHLNWNLNELKFSIPYHSVLICICQGDTLWKHKKWTPLLLLTLLIGKLVSATHNPLSGEHGCSCRNSCIST